MSPTPSSEKAVSTTASTDLSPAAPAAVGGPPMIDWALAQRVASGALLLKPAPASYRSRDLQGQFEDLTAHAETLVSEATGWRSGHGSARAKVTDRPGWATANVRSVERLIGPPLLELQRKRGAKLAGPSLAVGRVVAGTQLGLLLAYMATRVLGQYDLLIDDDSPEDQDLVSYVGPNILAVEEQYGFVPSQFRLWLALHEVTHRLQFTAVPWLRDHFVALVSELLGPLSGDPAGFVEVLRRAADEMRAGRNPAREAGVVAVLATPEQRLALSRISGMMSLLEGHGDVTMDRAGAAEVPGAAHFSQVLHERRNSARGLTKLVSKLLGLDAKMRQYAEGEHFVEAVEAEGGPALLARVWEGPEWLPTLEEIRDPASWVTRAGG
ncbi:MAG TPA: zinc-dependent metalloprotease [Acidimicrobiales bacterium]|nr:zinc-dependent metalloprotease [Acidimicrobiales bacterium]